MTDSLISPLARARFVVTLPPEPSHVRDQLQRMAGASFTTLTDTRDAFLHLTRRAQRRLVIMTPYIDPLGAGWAADLLECSNASEKIIVLRGTHQIDACGAHGVRLRNAATRIFDYLLSGTGADGQPTLETFHAKVILADGAAAYVGVGKFSPPIPRDQP